MIPSNSSGENNGAASLFDLLLSDLGNKLGLDDKRLVLRQNPFTQNLKVTELGDIEQGCLVGGGLVFGLLGEEGPQLVDVDDRIVEFVAKFVEVAHAYLPEETRMVLVEEDTVVMHATGVTATSGMLAVLSDTAVSGADVTSLLPVLLEPGRHFLFRSSLSHTICFSQRAAAQTN